MWLIYIFVFGFGTIIGSFLNVVIDRWNTGQTLGGRSRCDATGRVLLWYELIPVVSYLLQGGKARRVGTRLSPQYPLVECATGLVFVLLFQKFWPLVHQAPENFILSFLLSIAIFSVLIVIFVYDLRHMVIPNWFVWKFNLLSLLSIFLGVFSFWHLAAGPLVALPLFILWLVSKGKWIGFGDIKFALGMGWLLGVSGGFSALLLSFWIGALVGIVILLTSKSKDHKIPFAPFLIVGTFLAFLYTIDMASIALFFSSFLG